MVVRIAYSSYSCEVYYGLLSFEPVTEAAISQYDLGYTQEELKQIDGDPQKRVFLDSEYSGDWRHESTLSYHCP